MAADSAEWVTKVAHDGPVEQTERAAEDSAIRFLLDGLDVESLTELKRLVDGGRHLDALIEAAGPDFSFSFDDRPVLGRCPHGVDLDREFCEKGCRV